MLITYTYYHSDSKATPCGYSKRRSNISGIVRELRKVLNYFLNLLNFLKKEKRNLTSQSICLLHILITIVIARLPPCGFSKVSRSEAAKLYI
jgi:hypothetical protein